VNLPNYAGNTGSEAAHTHGTSGVTNGSMRATIGGSSSSDLLWMDLDTSGGDASYTSEITSDGGTIAFSTDGVSSVTSAAFVRGETAAGSSHLHTLDHNHASVDSGAPDSDVTGAASATDNRPAFYELVPVMRLEE
jgi:hypothetical protein